MSINLIRSPRKTDFNRSTTNQVVGPGYYNTNNSFYEGQREKYDDLISSKYPF